ncbi:MAG: glycosyl hydrolase family 28-related protein [Saprospiraceae bacterium]
MTSSSNINIRINISVLAIALISICNFVSCSKKNYPSVKIDGLNYISVMAFGTKGNGKTDDRSAIQEALNSGKNIYFPKGDYLLKSKTSTTALLVATAKNRKYRLFFEEEARLVVSPDQPTDYIKPAVLLFYAEKNGTINQVHIKGLNIEGNRDLHKIENVGILFYEKSGSKISNVYLENISVKNMGGGGIHTQARYNDFKKIYTENNGAHGIGVINTTNLGVENEFYLDGFTSIDDDAYSIDFSGYSKNGKLVKGYSWKGSAKNITSINSFYGIKTAGYWDLDLENVTIENSAHNGFFINVDAPGKTININNMTIINAKGNGMSLSGNTNVIAKNIKIEGCTVGLNIRKSNTTIENITIDGKHKNTASIRMGDSDVSIKNFTIKNASKKDEYPVWVRGENILLENGEFINNQSPNEMIIHETAKNVTLKNLKFRMGSNTRSSVKKKAITNIQKQGKTDIINCDFSRVTGKKIDDRTKRIKILK